MISFLLGVELLVWSDGAFGVSNHPRDELGYYLHVYGEVQPKDDHQIARAHDVFTRMRAVADKSAQRWPRLVVVKELGDPWAVALPSGHIVLSRQAVAMSHKSASVEEVEARLAFIIGHELAHLASDDFLHKEVLGFLTRQAKTANSVNESITDRFRKEEIELAADSKGFIYAALAGFPVKALLKSSPGQSSFFDFWVRQTAASISSSRTSPKKRAELLRTRMQALEKQLGFFDFGVRLSHFDYCDDAIYFFQEFQKTYPGREVLSNLGFCYLQRAKQEMAPERAYLYWMPLLLDGETRAIGYVHRGADSVVKNLKQALTGRAEGYLEEAVRYLRRAIEADPQYVPARLNFAVAKLYLGKPHEARGALTVARQLSPTNWFVRGAEALALYEQSDVGIDLWPNAVTQLEQLVSQYGVHPPLVYNLARLLQLRPRRAEAQKHWNLLATRIDELPAPIRSVVCRYQSKISTVQCEQTINNTTPNSPWSWPLGENDFRRLDQSAAQVLLPRWDAIPFDWFRDKLNGHIYRSPNDEAEVLVLDQFVQLQVVKGDALGSIAELSSHCPKTLRKRQLASGTVLSCGDWAALAFGERVREVWTVAR